MACKAVIFGDVVAEPERLELVESENGGGDGLVWLDSARLEGLGHPGMIFVDLDDSRFADPHFLMSLATTGERTSLIGKANKPDLEFTLRVAKVGITEVLTPDQCLKRLQSLLEAVKEAVPAQPSNGGVRTGLDLLVGSSPRMREIRKTVELLGSVDFPSALILGETGTGKSLVSRVLHNTGVRANHNLVEVNCSAIPDELFESELFGHVKGAFTDAKQDKRGLFEFANQGTLFLDEIGNLSASAQAKLLKVLEDKKLRKVGSVDEQDISVRVVAATNVDLESAISAGRFREDLFYRINLLCIDLPPLRHRPDDVIQLARHYLRYYATIYSKPIAEITESALASMTDYSWPGNIRELCNVIERAVLLSKGERLNVEDIDGALKRGRITAAERQKIIVELPPQGKPLDEIQHDIVKYVLDMHEWNKTEVAQYLGISRPRLRRIIEQAGLEQDRRR
jgi:two-component system response regulator HydG